MSERDDDVTEQEPPARHGEDAPERPPVSHVEPEERPDVLAAMAVYSADGQTDDASGNDAAEGARKPVEGPVEEPDREPHGPN
jgi:hypothetical protein